MTSYQRTIHQQAIREAEGYLDLATGVADQLPINPRSQTRLANRALHALERVTGRARRTPHVLYLIGQAYRVMRRYEQAVRPLSEAAQREPENILIWLALAWCHKRTERLDLAIESLENALAVESREAILHYNLACYWSLAGNPKIALRYLAQSLEIDPAYRQLIGDEPDFNNVRELPDFQSLVGNISDTQVS